MEELSFDANGARFHALADGPKDGPLALLLHGFPELSRSWRHQLPALAGRGFRAVAPDLRGYGLTERKGPYDIRTLTRDVAEIVHALGRERTLLIGHDWGGAIAFATASREPQVVERLVVLNAPHPYAMQKMLVRNPRQLRRSWYMFAFQIPWLPERLLSRNRGEMVARALRSASFNKSAWTDEEVEPYRSAFSDPTAASAALAYYRAALRLGPRSRSRSGTSRNGISAPTLIIWGIHDPALGIELIAPETLAPYFASGNLPEVRRIENAGHFVQNEAPVEVNQALLGWLG